MADNESAENITVEVPEDENAENTTVEVPEDENAENTTVEVPANEVCTMGQIMDAITALDMRISEIVKEVADLKSVRIESGAEYVDSDADDVESAYDDPDPRSIDELDLTL